MNGRIRAREVRVIGVDGEQVGVKSLGEAISLARANNVDLVEVAPNATPPVCRLVEYGRYEYEKAKREKESKKHQHANKVKEVQLSARIDSHDFSIKVSHAIDFLCEDMKVKASLRFRGREMAHKEFGFQVVEKFIEELAPYGHPDFKPKLVGRSVNVMFSPLPRNKRAPHPKGEGASSNAGSQASGEAPAPKTGTDEAASPPSPQQPAAKPETPQGFSNSPFEQL